MEYLEWKYRNGYNRGKGSDVVDTARRVATDRSYLSVSQSGIQRDRHTKICAEILTDMQGERGPSGRGGREREGRREGGI